MAATSKAYVEQQSADKHQNVKAAVSSSSLSFKAK